MIALPVSASSATVIEDVGVLEQPPLGATPRDRSPHWVWVLVRSTGDPPEQVWVRYQAEHAPEGLDVRPAAPPKSGSLGVAVVRLPSISEATTGSPEDSESTAPGRKYARRRARLPPTDRNLVTAQEFADAVGCSVASVNQLVKLGLPAIKAPGLGRRILKEQAMKFLVEGGVRRSRVALKLAKAAYRGKKEAAKGTSNGAG
jgi:hypothetical protein